jgi:hypothetical protein
MQITRRTGFFLSLLLVPALVLNPAPAHALVYPAGSVDTSWGNSGFANFGNESVPADYGFIKSADGGLYIPVQWQVGIDSGIGIDQMGPSGEDLGPFARINDYGIAPFVDFYSVIDLARDSNGNFILLASSDKGPVLVRLDRQGEIDLAFGINGVSLIKDLIENQIRITYPNSTLEEFGVGDIEIDAKNYTYVLGSLQVILNAGTPGYVETSVLWRFDANGNLETEFSNSEFHKGRVLPHADGYVADFSRSQLVINEAGSRLTVVEVVGKVNSPQEFFVQRFSVGNITPVVIQIRGQDFFQSTLGWNHSDFYLYDAIETNDNKLWIVGREYYCVADCERNSFGFRLDYGNGNFSKGISEENCTLASVALDNRNYLYAGGYCNVSGPGAMTPSLKRYSSEAILDTTFEFLPSSPQIRSWESEELSLRKLIVNNSRILAVGKDYGFTGCSTAIGISGCSISQSNILNPETQNQVNSNSMPGNFFATAYRISAQTVDDQPAPAPAPVVAPALPTQTAPVAVPAVMKVKKKLKFPITSQAGNPLKVTASGACKVSPVFKKVKVKVGKKTKKVKKQTGWTVQMKKKKKTCTITQSDAGGNGYAALSSTVTVKIK